jgi:hypothetical protein
MALVVTLSIVVLMTFLLVAFFSATTAFRTVENTSAGGVTAGILAQGAVGAVEAELVQEIIAGSTNVTVGTNTFYFPKAATNMLPNRAISVTATDTNFANLVKQSGQPFFSGATIFSAAATNSTATAAGNGRSISAKRWSTPMLTGAHYATNQAPNWIYVTPDGYTNTPTTNVIGRIAFNVYDLGGGLDANVAGFAPNFGTITLPPGVGTKGRSVWADLRAIPGINASAFASASSWPPQWRLTGDWKTFATNSGSSITYYERTGWRDAYLNAGGINSDRMFASRQDLIRYAKAHPGTFSSSDGLLPALQYLTTFSRSLPEPSLPAVDATTLGFPSADQFAAAYNGAFTATGYRDDGTTYSYEIKAGSPVLHKKFSLAKIARTASNGAQSWLTPTGPATGISDAAIKAVFGLKWNSSEERWDYTSPDGNTMTDHIKALSDVATVNRPPDFFEILKAGINPNSLGGSQNQSGANKFDSTQQLLQQSDDYQIFRIGASMIDNADGDNYPTRIAFDLAGDVEAAGVEDLPYLSGAYMRFAYRRQETPANSGKWRFYDMKFLMIPLLLNPHRERSPAVTPAPGDLRVEIQAGNVNEIDVVKSDDDFPDIPFLKSSSYVDFPRAIPTAHKPITNSHRMGSSTLNGNRDIGTSTASLDNAFVLTTLANVNPFPGNGTITKGQLNQRAAAEITDFSMVLTYKSPSGNYRVYDSLGGAATPAWNIDTDNKMTFGAPLSMGAAQNYTFEIFEQNIDAINPGLLLKFDPRTTRYGLSYSYGLTGGASLLENNDTTLPSSPELAATMLGPDTWGTFRIKTIQPGYFPASPLTGAERFTPAQLAQGGIASLSSGRLENIPDRPQDTGSPVRPSFAWEHGAASASATAINPLWTANARTPVAASSDLRPMILQRPYQSVAEIGHVFRDQPWKNVDFSHGTSPDLALLDLFALTEVEVPLAAGTINLNSARKEALTALFLEAGKQITANATAYNGTIDATGAASISDDVRTATTASPSRSNPEWVRNFLSQNATASAVDSELKTSAGKTKADREILARALTGATQTRVWNLMVDVIAQAGTSQEDGRFIVGGEARIWRNVAIDRLTGKILDAQTESVSQ